VFCAIVETIFNIRITHCLEQNSIFPPNKFGFRHQTSALERVSTLVADINRSVIRKEYVSAAFLDIKGAIPNVHIPILMQIMIRYWYFAHPHLLRWQYIPNHYSRLHCNVPI